MFPNKVMLECADGIRYSVSTKIMMRCSGLVRRLVVGGDQALKPDGQLVLPKVTGRSLKKILRWVNQHIELYCGPHETQHFQNPDVGGDEEEVARFQQQEHKPADYMTEWDSMFLATSLETMQDLIQHAEIMEVKELVKAIYVFLKENPDDERVVIHGSDLPPGGCLRC